MVKKQKLKKSEYAQEGGIRCPLCKSMSISFSLKFCEDERGNVTHGVDCTECGHSWLEIYKLIGYVITG